MTWTTLSTTWSIMTFQVATKPSYIFHSLIHHGPTFHILQWQCTIVWKILLFIFSGNSLLSFVFTYASTYAVLCLLPRGRIPQRQKKRIRERLLAHLRQKRSPSEERISKPRHTEDLEKRWEVGISPQSSTAAQP